MRALYHPAAGTVAWNESFVLLFLAPTANVRQIPIVLNDVPASRIIIARIQTQMLRRIGSRCWPCDDHA
jgi:hypothetical protein